MNTLIIKSDMNNKSEWKIAKIRFFGRSICKSKIFKIKMNGESIAVPFYSSFPH